MDFLKKHHITAGNVLKGIGIVIGCIIIATLLSSLFRASFGGFGRGMPLFMPFSGGYQGVGYDSIARTEKEGSGGVSADFSIRNLLPTPPYNGGTSGNNAENFEVTDYNATIETRKLERTCEIVKGLKEETYVIFENATESDRNCSYTFKVKHAKAAEVLAVIKSLEPKDLTENTYTIKRQIDDFTSETEILQKKRQSIDDTLKRALTAYDEITALATKTQNAEALAKIIDSKIQIIERLTQERININEQLDRLARAKEDQLDRLKYTRFYVSVYENRYIDGEQLRDSWKQELRNLVHSVNLAIQFVTTKLAVFFLWLLPVLFYILLLVVIVKYSWRFVQYIWKK